jgi:hypothetical protein
VEPTARREVVAQEPVGFSLVSASITAGIGIVAGSVGAYVNALAKGWVTRQEFQETLRRVGSEDAGDGQN